MTLLFPFPILVCYLQFNYVYMFFYSCLFGLKIPYYYFHTKLLITKPLVYIMLMLLGEIHPRVNNVVRRKDDKTLSKTPDLDTIEQFIATQLVFEKILLSVLKRSSQFTDTGGETHQNPAMPEHYATSPDKHDLLPPSSRSPVWRVLSCQTYRMQSGLEKELKKIYYFTLFYYFKEHYYFVYIIWMHKSKIPQWLRYF